MKVSKFKSLFGFGVQLFLFLTNEPSSFDLVPKTYSSRRSFFENVRLDGDHLYGKLLFFWLSLVMSLMVSFCAVPFPMRCHGWDLGLD